MFTVIELKDGGEIFYSNQSTLIRAYEFTYIGRVNLIENRLRFEIYFDGHNDKFFVKVPPFMTKNVHFDTFNDCKTFVFNEISRLKYQIDTDQDELQRWMDSKKKRGKKKNGNK